jgi:hypothetical protein
MKSLNQGKSLFDEPGGSRRRDPASMSISAIGNATSTTNLSIYALSLQTSNRRLLLSGTFVKASVPGPIPRHFPRARPSPLLSAKRELKKKRGQTHACCCLKASHK